MGIYIPRAEDSLGKRKVEAEDWEWERRRNALGVGLHRGLSVWTDRFTAEL